MLLDQKTDTSKTRADCQSVVCLEIVFKFALPSSKQRNPNGRKAAVDFVEQVSFCWYGPHGNDAFEQVPFDTNLKENKNKQMSDKNIDAGSLSHVGPVSTSRVWESWGPLKHLKHNLSIVKDTFYKWLPCVHESWHFKTLVLRAPPWCSAEKNTDMLPTCKGLPSNVDHQPMNDRPGIVFHS